MYANYKNKARFTIIAAFLYEADAKATGMKPSGLKLHNNESLSLPCMLMWRRPIITEGICQQLAEDL